MDITELKKSVDSCKKELEQNSINLEKLKETAAKSMKSLNETKVSHFNIHLIVDDFNCR